MRKRKIVDLSQGEFFKWDKDSIHDWQIYRRGRQEGSEIWLTLKDPQGIEESPRRYYIFIEVWTY